jgi:hypothetical protein
MKTKELRWCDLDAKWTPKRGFRSYGLHLDSQETFSRPEVQAAACPSEMGPVI